MRSRAAVGLPGRCPICWIRRAHCICAEIPQVTNRTQVVIVRHFWERRKSTGTARPALLALRQCQCWELGCDPAPVNALLGSLSNSWLLYPGPPPSAVPSAVPETLVVLDGTWAQTRRMLRRLDSLHHVPRLALPPKSNPPLRLRHSSLAEGRSTLEAIADALRWLEETTAAERLEHLHQLYVQQVLRARGSWNRVAERTPKASETELRCRAHP
ncbi:tRNA-uridine aminocarboxypropyltransferase [Myxococcota bacterium]